jgi:D-alanyl-lipoteichoic acid acyltransferase DltB (MBOAT superfamily)
VLFPTFRFALFFAVVLPANWLLMPHPRRWRLFMLAASFYFYGAWDWHYTFLLAASILANQAFAVRIDRAATDELKNRWTAVAVVANLGALGWFKYAGFLSESAGGLFDRVGMGWELPVPAVLLPIGISFFTFQALSYVIDVRRGKLHPVPFLDFAVYLSFFPHLVAGPIVRAAEFLPQLRQRRDPRRVQSTLAFWLIGIGLVKKVVVASYLAEEIVDPLFAFPGQHGGVEALVGIYAYAIQIYADFSGYTDMAIGLALLLGFRFPQNFDAPYTAVSLQDFWRRWHMTLSRWLRDYLYVPLGGNRGGRRNTYRNLILTMVLGGLWHGAAWTFVIWGGLHGGWLALERWLDETGKRPKVLANPWVGRLVTFHVVCLGWVFFRASGVDDALDILGRVVVGSADAALNSTVVAVVALMLASQFVPTGAVRRVRAGFSRWALPAQAGALAAVLVLVDVLGPEGVPPFIYFQF